VVVALRRCQARRPVPAPARAPSLAASPRAAAAVAAPPRTLAAAACATLVTRGWPRGPAKRRRPECASAREPARSPSQAAAVAALRRTLAAAAPARRAPLRRLRQIARPPTPVSVAPALVSAAAGESEPSPVRLATLASAPDLVVSLPRVQPRGSLNSRRLFDRRTSRPRPRRSLRALTPSRERPARRASVGPRRPAGGEETRAAFARIWHRDCLPRRRRPSGSAARVALRLAQADPAGRRAVAPHRNRKPRHPPSHRSPNHTAQRLRQCGRHRCRAGAPARRDAPSARAAGCVIRQRRLPPGRSPARQADSPPCVAASPPAPAAAPAASHAAWPRPAPGGHADSCLPPHRRWKARQQCCCACRGA